MAVAKRQVTTGVPGIAVRYDDNTAVQIPNLLEWIRRGWSPAVSCNWSNLREGGPTIDSANVNARMRKADLRFLADEARANGCELIPLQHSNTNWLNATSMTWQQILAELDPRPIEDFFGRKVRVYVQPGDAASQAFVFPRRSLIIEALQYWGIEFAIGLQLTASGAVVSGQTVSGLTQVLQAGLVNSATVIDDPTHVANGFQNMAAAVRPGVITDPYLIPEPWTVDLGGYVVVRGAKSGSTLLPDPHSGATPWMIGEDNNGLGLEGASPVTNFSRILQMQILMRLGMGLWTGLAMHGDDRTNDTVVSNLSANRGSAGNPQKLPGHFSSKHLADFCDRLRKKGHCRALNVEEFCEEIVSGFAEGTDLVANPGFAVPQFDIDELQVGLPHMVYPRGASYIGAGQNSQSEISSFPQRLPAADASGRFVSPVPIEEVVGSGVAGYRGSEGGLILMPENQGAYSTVKLGQVMLAPGLYRCRLVGHDYVSGNLQIGPLSVIGVRLRYRTAASIGGNSVAEPEFTVVQTSGKYQVHNVPGGGEMYVEMYFELPREAEPVATGQITAAVGPVNAGATAVIGVVNVPNAQPGDQAWAILRDVALPAGVGILAEVTAPGKVTLTLVNDSASSFTQASDQWTAFVATKRVDNNVTDVSGPAGQWVYNVGYTLTKGTNTPITLSHHAFELVEAR